MPKVNNMEGIFMRKYVLSLVLTAVILLVFTSCNDNSNSVPNTPEQNPPAASGDLQPYEPSDQPESMLENSGGIRHQFDSLGFSVEFPAFWEGKFGLNEIEIEMDFGIRHFVEVYHISTREELGSVSGTLLSLGRSPRDHYTYDGERPVMAGGMIFLAQTGGNTYFVSFPSGVEHSEAEGSASAAEYLEMVGHWEESHWDFLISSFRLINSP